jgi:hypothetical protein
VGLLDEVLHYVAARYREEKNPRALAKALEWLDAKLGREAVDTALLRFTEDFPPVAVYQAQSSASEYLQGKTQGVSNRHIALEEMLMLWLSNTNPALKPFNELFDDKSLSDTAYRPVMTQLREFFDTQPRFGPNNQNLIDMLRAPALMHPDSVTAQLEWLLRSWSELGEEFFQRLLSSLDFIKEEEKPVFFGPGPSIVPTYERGAGGPWRCHSRPRRAGTLQPRPGLDARVVLLAKNATCGSTNSRSSMAARFAASTRCRMKNSTCWRSAVSPACGSSAMGTKPRLAAHQADVRQPRCRRFRVLALCLRHRARPGWRRGDARPARARRATRHRMASDMVPNHMAIDSRWVVEHPNWFLSLPHSPFPTYTFGASISQRMTVSAFIWKIITIRSRMRRWCSSASITGQERNATFITATTAPARRGTIRRSSIICKPKCARASSKPFCTWRGSSPSSALTPR